MEPGNLYHIYNRGNNKQPIFFERKNYHYFLERFDKYLSNFVDVYAYCLMPNHFHFLIKIKELLKTSKVLNHFAELSESYETFEVLDGAADQTSKVLKPFTGLPESAETFEVLHRPPLSPMEKAFKNLFISYSKTINKAYDRTGSLFQVRYKQKEITDDGYFTSIIQYIHANPQAAGLCNTYEDWEFSSYNAIIGSQPTKVKREEVLEWFGNKEIFIKVHKERELEREQIRQFLFD